jgi:hypothetical protein
MMPFPQPETKVCLFKELDNHIWAFEFRKSNNQAVDEWIMWQNYFKHLPPEPDITTVRTLLDFRPEGFVPLRYALQKNAEWRKQNPDIQSMPVKVAIVLRRSYSRLKKSYAELVKDGINTFGMRTVRIELFYDNYQQAVDWLIEP